MLRISQFLSQLPTFWYIFGCVCKRPINEVEILFHTLFFKKFQSTANTQTPKNLEITALHQFCIIAISGHNHKQFATFMDVYMESP